MTGKFPSDFADLCKRQAEAQASGGPTDQIYQELESLLCKSVDDRIISILTKGGRYTPDEARKMIEQAEDSLGT